MQTCDHSGNTNPTCLSTTCSVCGGTVPKTEHIRAQFKHDERGHWAYCTKCDSILSRVLPHTWDNGVVTDPGTCLAPGSMKYTCTACGETKAESITGNHDYRDAHDADNHYQECSVCGDKKNVEAHKWNEGVVTDPGTCVTPGSVKYTCTVCSETKTESITGEHDYKDAHDKDNHYQECALCHDKKDVEAHKFVWKIDRAATTTKEGEKHEECSVCG